MELTTESVLHRGEWGTAYMHGETTSRTELVLQRVNDSMDPLHVAPTCDRAGAHFNQSRVVELLFQVRHAGPVRPFARLQA